MSELLPNDFSSYALTEEEQLQGTLLTITQKQVIQNQLSIIAHEKNALDYDPTNPILFAQQEAGLKGQMGMLRYILDQSQVAEEYIASSASDPNT